MLLETARPAVVRTPIPASTPPAGLADVSPVGRAGDSLTGRASQIAQLRDRLVALERGATARAGVAALGIAALDEVLPGGGLTIAGLHQIAPQRAEWDAAPTAGFALALAASLRRARPSAKPFFWLSSGEGPYGPGLAAYGFDPATFLFVAAQGQAELCWAAEEILRSGQAAAVLCESATLDRTAARRLQLAAETGATPCLLMERRAGEVASPALTRWLVAAAPSGPAEADDLPGATRWQVCLTRARAGTAPHDFLLEWDNAAGAFALATRLRDGALAAQPSEGRAKQAS